MDDWRIYLYPLGFLASIAFGARFIIQWLQSEKAHKVVVPRIFWQLSLLGNILFLIHCLIQFQFHLSLVQGCNAIISWRNLNLMQNSKPPASFRSVVILLIATIAFISAIFGMQDWLLQQDGHWFRVPATPWQNGSVPTVSLLWHFLGTIGYWLFNSRFWVQWWLTEKAHLSILPPSFWWISLIGALMSISYFAHIGDIVNLVNPVMGFIPYIRNLMIYYKSTSALQKS